MINFFSAIVYLNYSIVFIDFCSYGRMNLSQTTTGNNENTFHHLNQIQLFSMSTVITYSFYY